MISRLSIKSIVEAKPKSLMGVDHVSQLEYFSARNNNLCVFADQRTILGVDFSQNNVILKENIAEPSTPIVSYNQTNFEIFSLALDERNGKFLAAGSAQSRGSIVQYDLETGHTIRDFRMWGFDQILSKCRHHNLCFLGTMKHYLIVVDFATRAVVYGLVQTAVKKIDALELGHVQSPVTGPKMLLFVAGRERDYSESKTDVFDITGLIKEFANRPIESE